MSRLFVDTDPGIDDALALAMVLGAARERIAGIGTVAGNVDADRATRNAALLLEDAQARDVPLHRGADASLLGTRCDASDVHGSDGLGGTVDRAPRLEARPPHAVRALIDAASASPGEPLDLLALGPLTNLALALALDPGLPERLGRVVWMGGTIAGQGNATAAAEFNAYVDPEAVARVLAAGLRLEIVSWETTLDHRIPLDELRGWIGGTSPLARRALRMLDHLVRAGLAGGADGVALPDPLAAAVMLEPSCVLACEQAPVSVALSGRARGQTIVDRRPRRDPDLPVVTLVTRIDVARLADLVRGAFR